MSAFLFSANAQPNLDTSRYAIFKFDSNNCWVFNKNDKPTELTDQDINKIEKLLVKCISNYNIKQKKYSASIKKSHPYIDETQFFIDLPKYKKQYLAIINSKKEKEIWVNCFRPSHDADFNYWRKKIVRVNDGGNYFFNVIINLTRNKYYQFRENGIG
jgi:hypothetical protein